jgi:hypothetical protein
LDKSAKEKNKGKKPIERSDVLGLISVLNAIIKHARVAISKKWQQRSISKFIFKYKVINLEQFLDIELEYKIRKAGFELLINFIDALQENCDEIALDLLMATLDFKVFGSNKVKLPKFKTRGKLYL